MIPPNLIPVLIRPITEEEVAAALWDLRTQKTPGPDGLPAEFFTTFAELAIPLITRMLQDAWI